MRVLLPILTLFLLIACSKEPFSYEDGRLFYKKDRAFGVVFVMQNCASCTTLLQNINKAMTKKSFDFVAISLLDEDLQALKKSKNINFPLLANSKTIEKAIGTPKAAPFTIFFDKNGEVFFKKYGTIDEEKLLDIITTLTKSK
ncbi:hypothetical protein [uncultured Campylobacter sp.]|uniref:TlpA family protein disulfide reductase n=1 Tax=uncultured Campylobacter sp. TaxID=218934 RepID=UPI0026187381|nr:hypothetical protein [uncultured Campylobacter sp.]